MPRRNIPRRARGIPAPPPPPVGGAGATRREAGPDGTWLVRAVPAERAAKRYRCPGCDHEIQPGTGHVVAWPDTHLGSSAERRHWHTSCWDARTRRAPTRRWW